MIKINSLYSLECISDIYAINDNYDVINVNTGKIKKATESKRDGYLYYTLATKDKKNKKVYAHKIIALAFVNNGEYEVINHIDGNKQNNLPSNLEFTDIRGNTKHAWDSGLITKESAIYELELKNGATYEGTIEELSELTSIPIMTLYDNTYKKRNSRKIQSIKKLI